MTDRVYFDYNATSPLDKRAVERMRAALEVMGNPSSVHADGRTARDLVEEARRAVATMVNAEPSEVVFTGSGTEADALGIVGLARLALASQTDRAVALLTTAIEHPACVGAIADLAAGQLARGSMEVHHMPIDSAGRIDLEAAFGLIANCPPGVVVTHLSNHELGTVQDITGLSQRASAAGWWVHCDAVQAAGKMAIDVAALGVDSLAVSGHKIGGPKGVGALWIRQGLDLAPLVTGGHQERGRRPGTENVVGIAGFGLAAEVIAERLAAAPRVAELASRLRTGLLQTDGAQIHGPDPGIGNTVLCRFPGAPGEVVVQALDIAGVAVSTGAACTSGSVEPSAVLLGLGLDRGAAAEAVRFSLGPENTAAEVDYVASLIPAIVARAREFS